MKKLLMCCMVILLAVTPVMNVNAATANAEAENIMINQFRATDVKTGHMINPLDVSESYIISADQKSMTVSSTITYQGEVVPAATIIQTRSFEGLTYKGTLYLQYYYYVRADNQTTAYYEGTLYLQGSTS